MWKFLRFAVPALPLAWALSLTENAADLVWFALPVAEAGACLAAVLKAGDCVVATTRREQRSTIPAGFEEKSLCLKLDISEQDMSVYETAVTGFSMALSFEVEPFGIKVTNVAPGVFRTGFYDATRWGTQADTHINDYDVCRWQTALVAEFQKKQQPGDPEKLAQVILAAAGSPDPPLHLAIGEDAPGVLDAYCEKIEADTDAWRAVASKTSY